MLDVQTTGYYIGNPVKINGHTIGTLCLLCSSINSDGTSFDKSGDEIKELAHLQEMSDQIANTIVQIVEKKTGEKNMKDLSTFTFTKKKKEKGVLYRTGTYGCTCFNGLPV